MDSSAGLDGCGENLFNITGVRTQSPWQVSISASSRYVLRAPNGAHVWLPLDTKEIHFVAFQKGMFPTFVRSYCLTDNCLELLQNCEKRLLASSCLSVCVPTWNNSRSSRRIFLKFCTSGLFQNLSIVF